MAVYSSGDEAREVFEHLFSMALADGEFATKLEARGLSLHFLQTGPALGLFVSAEGVIVDRVPFAPALRFEMSTDTAHAIWLGQLPIARATATRRLAIKGQVARLRHLVDLLPIVSANYSTLLAGRFPLAAGTPIVSETSIPGS